MQLAPSLLILRRIKRVACSNDVGNAKRQLPMLGNFKQRSERMIVLQMTLKKIEIIAGLAPFSSGCWAAPDPQRISRILAKGLRQLLTCDTEGS